MVSYCFDDVNVYVSFLIFLFLMGALCSKLIVAVLFCQSCPFLLPDPLFSSQHVKKIVIYYINTSEIPSELSRENFISSHVKITCYLHT